MLHNRTLTIWSFLLYFMPAALATDADQHAQEVLEQQKHAQHLEFYNKIISSSDKNGSSHQAPTYHQMALRALNEHKYEEAIKNFSTAITQEPTSAILYHSRGLVQLHQAILFSGFAHKKDDTETYFNNTIYDFTEAIKLFPTYADAYYHRAIAYYQHNDCPKAYQDSSKAINLVSSYEANLTIQQIMKTCYTKY